MLTWASSCMTNQCTDTSFMEFACISRDRYMINTNSYLPYDKFEKILLMTINLSSLFPFKIKKSPLFKTWWFEQNWRMIGEERSWTQTCPSIRLSPMKRWSNKLFKTYSYKVFLFAMRRLERLSHLECVFPKFEPFTHLSQILQDSICWSVCFLNLHNGWTQSSVCIDAPYLQRSNVFYVLNISQFIQELLFVDALWNLICKNIEAFLCNGKSREDYKNRKAESEKRVNDCPFCEVNQNCC